ncbi:RNP domain protein [Drepanopeziza brunnea f. sp. 'multigermtubi' MB_m1]|uniref:RNP domain protein n=1 Tax=Marssonina brunnea f. sp. multigermtubi (strain MB_m1) TaxID=1072389 RepID=K1X6I5_MARBU|nr:RNP domain protein [Drepanopeziza brunnea f. sp. 'multigermtubi' MB_m1]EKD20696.1 RNP domain protein [Drepanopeziza brunnea f. sp. 'multigermtubi' MB_m1]
MSYPPPPGLPSKSTPAPHPSLPARPPPSSTPSFKPAFNASRANMPSAFPGFAPRSVAPPTQSYNAYPQPAYLQQQPQAYNGYNAAPQQETAYGAAPQIRNPFAPPSATPAGAAARYDEDPEMAAQIAQWQSAYAAKDTSSSSSGGYTGIVRRSYPSETSGNATSANAAPLGGAGPSMSNAAMTSAAHNDTGVATVVNDAKTNTKTVVRSGGGSTWTDSSLLEWDPAHFRLFVGNLAGEVTDESLQKAFSRWPSVQKARVIRDKRTTKSKGYGFVSFSDGDDFFQAARDMQGKYIGSHPVLLRRSTTEIKAVNPRDKNRDKHGKGGKGKGKEDKTGAGVQKSGSKTKGGLKVLG